MLGHWNMGWGFGVIGLIFNLLMIGAVIVAVVFVIRAVSSSNTGVSGSPAAERILSERFARGEIDAAEYQSRLRVLRGGDPAP